MLSSFFRHTASATALFLAAGGMHIPLLAATTVKPAVSKTTTVAAPHWPNATGWLGQKPRAAKTAKAKAKRPQTPFETVMLPRIKADMAKHAAENALHGIKPTVAPRAASSPSGGGPNFAGFQSAGGFQAAYGDVELSVAADFNKDGKLDLVSLEYHGTLDTVLSAGTASASPLNSLSSYNDSADTYYGSASFDTIQAADLNQDGYPDIEVVDQEHGYAYIWMNNGDGTFANVSQVSIALPSGDAISAPPIFEGDVVFADVTGDGRPDMVVISGSPVASNTLQLSYSVFNGVGNGTFPSSPSTTASTTLPNDVEIFSFHSLQVVDVNGDGKADLVLPVAIEYYTGTTYVGLNYTFVMTGNSLGVFSPPAGVTSSDPLAYNVGNNDSFGRTYFGTLSSGKTGLLIAGENGLYGQISNGDGTLQPAVTTLEPDNNDFNDIEFADVTGDGKPDAIFYVDGYLSIYAGNGDGSFSPTVTGEYVSTRTYEVYGQPKPADFNGDGIVDIPVAGEYGDSAVMLGKGNGLFAGAPIVSPPVDEAYDTEFLILSGNITGKGFSDVLLYDYSGDDQLVVGANDGHGNFTYSVALPNGSLPPNFEYVQPFAVDINGDGYTDILLADSVGGIYYALNKADGTGTFATPVALNLGGTVSCELGYGAVGDLNGDGKPDLVLAFDGCGTGDFTSGGIFSLINQGNGTYTNAFTLADDAEPYALYLADFNNDGILDVAVLSDGEYVTMIKGVGDGTFDNTNLVYVPLPDASDLYGIAVGDYDNDGKQDLVLFGWQNEHSIYLLKGNGDFTFQSGPTYEYYGYGVGGQLVDLNGDGALDIVFNFYPDDYYPYYPSTGYIINSGKGGFNAPVLLSSTFNDDYDDATDGYGTPVVVADFNGDGAPDFASVSYEQSGIFYNLGGISLALTASSPTITQDSSVTLTAALTPSLGTAAATGTVTFYDNGTAIGVESVSANAATLSLSTLPVGANTITAVYSGDANYNIASSTANVNMTAVTVTPLAPSFTLAAASGASMNLTVGETGTATFTLTGNATFTGPIALTCAGAPAASSCTISPSTVTLTGAQSGTFTAVIATTAPNNNYNAGNTLPTWWKAAGSITLAGGLLLLWPSRRRGVWTLVLAGTLALGAMTSLSGCGSTKTVTVPASYTYAGTTPGSYTITVTATGGSVTQTGTIALTVHN